MQNDGVKFEKPEYELLIVPLGTKPVTKRRMLAYNRLVTQLNKGQKTPKKHHSDYFVLLSNKDKERIHNEMQTLKTKI